MTVYHPSGEEFMSVLRDAKVMAPNVSVIAMISAYAFAKFLERQGYADEFVNCVHDLARSKPPPVRYRPGTDVPTLRTATRVRDFTSLPFPATLPEFRLSTADSALRYGLSASELPARVAREIRQFCEYSSALVNTERGLAYAAPTQQTTLVKHVDRIRAFLGFALRHLDIAAEDLSLDEFLVPNSVARYLSFLRARDCKKTYVRNHLALVRKVVHYLTSGSADTAAIRAHAEKMADWLNTVEVQLRISLPGSTPPELPESAPVRQWVTDLTARALLDARDYLEAGEAMGKRQASQVRGWGGGAGATPGTGL